MSRVLAIDYGKKRSGIAVTDPMRIVASPLKTVETQELLTFLESYFKDNDVDLIVVGLPLKASGEETDATEGALKIAEKIRRKFKDLDVVMEEEAFTSVNAVKAMIEGGMKKKDRKNKGNIDKISAALILQSYLGIS